MSYRFLQGDPILEIDITNPEKALPMIDKLLERTQLRLNTWREAHQTSYKLHLMQSEEKVTIPGITSLLDKN